MDALGVNLPGLIAQIVNFSLLLGLLYMVLYKPVIRMLDNRSQRIQESLDEADRLKEETSKSEDLVKQQLEEARQEGRNIVAQATQVAERVREEARDQARSDADGIISRAQAEIQRERDEAIEDLRSQFADLTILAAERVINTSLDDEQHRRLIEEVLQQGPNIGQN
ncbi:F0F1 ATP synthase subunit B [Dehalococcoidia bacterium]|nr:F0F1 ATP synthase subunit B [Dehalococcoidia bacterium]